MASSHVESNNSLPSVTIPEYMVSWTFLELGQRDGEKYSECLGGIDGSGRQRP
jgi:hypothetical protein